MKANINDAEITITLTMSAREMARLRQSLSEADVPGDMRECHPEFCFLLNLLTPPPRECPPSTGVNACTVPACRKHGDIP